MTEIRFVSWCHWGISFWIGERNHGKAIARIDFAVGACGPIDGTLGSATREAYRGICREWVTRGQEQGDEGARWVYGIEAASPEGAVEPALKESLQHGYPIAPAHVQVWSSECQGCTIGHQPLHEVVS